MPAGAHAVLYRLTAARASLSSLTRADEKVEFSGMGVGIVDWSMSLERHRPSVPAPQAEASNKPDSGVNSLQVSLDFVAHRMDMGTAPSSRAASPVDTLRKWAVLPQFVPGVYDRGNVGLWFWPDEILTHHPTRSTGYKLIMVNVSGMPNQPTKTLVKVDLEWAGEFESHNGLGVST